MNRSRTIIQEIKVHMSTRARKSVHQKTHYETLKVSQSSTQDDIKSAYYKLSKEFHPDVNKTEGAKKSFQDISDAYEVLGNFNKRKLYDRNLMATGHHVSQSVNHDVAEDPMAGFYKSRTYNTSERTDFTATGFDFDAWTQAHYGRTLHKSLKYKSEKIKREQYMKQQELDIENNQAAARLIISVAITIITLLTLQRMYFDDYDKNLIREKRAHTNDSRLKD
ncbi:hypothetical protein TKK_0012924 [Trichogramma kaykai]|uniref:J domain-containing protein n=1 Tax=Trichogramma kaykai TaxID=54128 RepID=A0ABD2WLA0_9HYME